MGGEGGAAHAHDAGLPDDAGQVLRGQALQRLPGLHRGSQGFLKVVFDDHGQNRGSAGMGPGLHRLHRSGDGAMYRHAKALIVADFLAQVHMVPLIDQRLTGGADVLGHGNHHKVRRRKRRNGPVPGQFLPVPGVYAAEERKCHS